MGIKRLLEGKPFNTPLYNVFQSKRLEITDKLIPTNFIIIEGRLLLHVERIKKLLDFSVYLDTDLDVLLSRRIYKSLAGKIPLEDVVSRYERFVKPNHEKYTEAVKRA